MMISSVPRDQHEATLLAICSLNVDGKGQSMAESAQSSAIKMRLPLGQGYSRILTPEALGFVADLHRRFDHRRLELLAARAERQRSFDGGSKPDFLPETKAIRETEWQGYAPPPPLLALTVE